MRRSYRTLGWGWWCTQSVALGWYTVSRWDTGGVFGEWGLREGVRVVGWTGWAGLGLSALGRPLMGDVRGVLRDDVHPAQSEERGGGEEVFVVRVDFREAIFRGGC